MPKQKSSSSRNKAGEPGDRTRLEEELRESRLQLEEATDLARIAYWEYDAAGGEFIFNDAFYELYATTAVREGGYRMTREEYDGRFVHPDDLKELNRRIAESRARPRVDEFDQFEHRAVRRDGKVIHILTRTKIARSSEGRFLKIVGVNQDVTSRREIEDALRGSEIKLRAILDGSRDALVVAKDGIRTFVNPAYVSLFGYESADELIGKSIIDAIAPESRDFVLGLARKRGSGEPAPTFYEAIGLRKDGTTFLMDATISSYILEGEQYILAVLRDITDRRKAEDEARLLKRSIDVHYDGAYWINTDNEFVYLNEAACKGLGYEREELLGKTVYELDGAVTPEIMEDIWETLRKNGSLRTESIGRRKDGSEIPVEIVSAYVQFGSREYVYGFVRDISERRRLEEQLRQAQKMEAVGTLAGGIAHDFNNMLAVIIGNAELALDDTHDEGPRENLKQILKASKRSRDLVKQVLTFSRRNGGRGRVVEMAPLLRETYELLRASLPSTIHMDLKVRTKHDTVLADPSQIQQVVVNLANNAAHAMRERGGTLTIGLSSVALGRHSLPEKVMRPGLYAKLTVRDTGTGIAPDVQRRMFEPFFTTKEPGEGTGMGLSVVYGIMKGCDGMIEVKSAVGAGSTFTVLLPQSDAASTMVQEEETPFLRAKERVLFVDDEPAIVSVTGEMLERMGCRVTALTDASEALRVFRGNQDGFDLVITDQTMPDMTGIALAKEIMTVRKEMPVILCTGYSERVSRELVREAGIQGFMMKPVTKSEMAQEIRRVLKQGEKPG